jgi:hypothetical protein
LLRKSAADDEYGSDGSEKYAFHGDSFESTIGKD